MTREELNEVLADIKPILKANAECKMKVETNDYGINLIPEMRGFTGFFLQTIGAYLNAHSVSWIVVQDINRGVILKIW